MQRIDSGLRFQIQQYDTRPLFSPHCPLTGTISRSSSQIHIGQYTFLLSGLYLTLLLKYQVPHNVGCNPQFMHFIKRHTGELCVLKKEQLITSVSI